MKNETTVIFSCKKNIYKPYNKKYTLQTIKKQNTPYKKEPILC